MLHDRALNALVVEDEAIIAFSIADMIAELGDVSVSIAISFVEAMRAAKQQTIDFAILDFNMGRNTNAAPVAEILAERGIPFVFATASEDAVRRQFPKSTVLSKPVSPTSLKRAINAIDIH